MRVPRVFCLVDATDPRHLLGDLAALGVDGFQVRATSLTTRDLIALTNEVIEAVRPYGAAVVVNDRLDVALATAADGVHLGASDLPVRDARRMAPGLLIGATCRDPRQVRDAAAAGASYAGFGPVFPTSSKGGLPDPLGPDAIGGATGVLPLIAIGGIDAVSARRCRVAGAHGVAVIGAVWRQPDPLRAAKELVTAVA